MKRFVKATTIMAFAAVLCAVVPNARAQVQTIQGKVWVVSVAEASNAAFPAPSATPDATFTTNGIGYVGHSPSNCFTINTFLTRCGTPGSNLTFSGLPNPNLGGRAAGPSTKMSGERYGVMIEFTGNVVLGNNQVVGIIHDDGCSLMIDGSLVGGFNTGSGVPILQTFNFAGEGGTHTFDLLYANTQGGPGDGAMVLFTPLL